MTAYTIITKNTGTPTTFTSAFQNDADAAAVLAQSNNRSEFARDLILLQSRNRLSDVQRAWLHKLATETTGRGVQAVVAGLNLASIVTLMDRAAAAQKRAPKIRLTTPHGDPVVLSRATERSKAPGTVRISNGAAYGSPNNQFFGAVNRDGSVSPSRGWKFDVEALLFRLAKDPAAVAGQHGIATGRCSFCGRLLSTKESRSVGYGPDCAEAAGLPWGHVDPALDAADAAARNL